MIVSIMQPYLFPYIGYYQMANHSDQFVIFDDVNYIKKGFINRNHILFNRRKHRFSAPVKKISQFRKINEHEFDDGIALLLPMFERAYRKARNFDVVYPLIVDVFCGPRNVATFTARSITKVFDYLGLPFECVYSSDLDIPSSLSGVERIIFICKLLGASTYLNAIGGRGLYSSEHFVGTGIELQFIQSISREYHQASDLEFVSFLSIIDILMHNSIEDTLVMLNNDFELIDPAGFCE